jgi:hypothetical protein
MSVEKGYNIWGIRFENISTVKGQKELSKTVYITG